MQTDLIMLDFPGRQPHEKVLFVIRKHPIVFVRNFVFFIGVCLLPLILFFFFWSRSFPLSGETTIGLVGYLGASLYFLYGTALLMMAFLADEFDLFILTDFRLIDVTQVTLFKRTVAITPLNQIQDTTSDISGVFGTLLNYGSVDVQTAAGDASNFTISHVPDPAMAARKILNQAEIRREEDISGRNHSGDA